jgi:pantoate--beta-alanine ligase
MRIIETIKDLKAIIKSQKTSGKTIGFVPTMGYLHDGHISLAKESLCNNDFTIMSIFVNPTQFGKNEDFGKYPRSLDRDSQMAEQAGVDVIFIPAVIELYPEGYKTYINVEGITEKLCGITRPGHFKGVTTIVNKLFNIVEPNKAYFGQKDAQQAIVIKKMVKDLNMNIEIVICPIVREADGLALSSRNVYLNPEERRSALVLSKSLFYVEDMIKKGEHCKEKIINFIREKIALEKLASVDYISVANAETLDEIEKLEGKILIALAVRFGQTRLIDNVTLEV